MNRKFNGLIGLALAFYAQAEINREEWKKEILRKWDESRKYPRKKKKKIRKQLKLEWAIANWDPYKDLKL